MQAAKKQVDSIMAKETENLLNSEKVMDTDVDKEEKRQKFINSLVTYGISLKLATQACDQVSAEALEEEDISEGNNISNITQVQLNLS